jgi:fluoride ion exporter CrcB/FEX
MFKYSMNYLLWIIVGALGAVAIYWLMDWHDKFPDGE